MTIKTTILAFLAAGTLLTGCAMSPDAAPGAVPSASEPVSIPLEAAVSALPDTLFETYYLSPEDPVYTYLQNKSIRKFFNMWTEEYIGENLEITWNYDALAPVQLLDHNFKSIAKSDPRYTCTFTTGDGRYGYIIVSYGTGKEGPYISKWSLHKSTPYQYDLRANSGQIADALKKTDIDLPTASAVRVEWIDTEKNRGDRIILFANGKNDQYICYLGDDDFTIEKQTNRQLSM